MFYLFKTFLVGLLLDKFICLFGFCTFLINKSYVLLKTCFFLLNKMFVFWCLVAQFCPLKLLKTTGPSPRSPVSPRAAGGETYVSRQFRGSSQRAGFVVSRFLEHTDYHGFSTIKTKKIVNIVIKKTMLTIFLVDVGWMTLWFFFGGISWDLQMGVSRSVVF